MGDLLRPLFATWNDEAAIEAVIERQIPKLLALDAAYANALTHSDPDNARVECEAALQRAISAILSDYLQLFEAFRQNPGFRRRLTALMLAADERSPGRRQPGTSNATP